MALRLEFPFLLSCYFIGGFVFWLPAHQKQGLVINCEGSKIPEASQQPKLK